MTAGAVAVPTIIPLRPPQPGQHKTAVDTRTKIELKSETEGARIYYTTNGSKPEPFKNSGHAARSTNEYREPFRLSAGKRTIKAIAVADDGRESFVVTKVFDVEQLTTDVVMQPGDDLEFMSEIPVVQQAKRDVQKFADKMVTGKEAWAEVQRMKQSNGLMSNGVSGSNGLHRNGTGSFMDTPYRHTPLTDGDVNPRERWWMNADNHTQTAVRCQPDSNMKCPRCFASRPFDVAAIFCPNCGFTLPTAQQMALSPLDAEQLGPCWNCKSLVPLSMSKCLVCEVLLHTNSDALVPATPFAPLSSAGAVDRLVCTICGTPNAPNRSPNCTTCNANLRTCAKPVRLDPANPSGTQAVTLKCSQCGYINSADVTSCDRCNAMSLSANVKCSVCSTVNAANSQFCGTCGLALIVPPAAASSLRNTNASSPYYTPASMLLNKPAAEPPLLTGPPIRYVPPMKDAITQTVGLNYTPPQSDNLRNTQEQSNSKVSAADREVKEPKPLLTAISAGRGYWRKQMEHICGHMKAHAAITPDFRSLVSEPRLGKVVSASVEEEGDEFTVVVTFKVHEDVENSRRRHHQAAGRRGGSAGYSTDDNESVDELRGISQQLLRTYGHGRRAYNSDDLDSDRSAKSTVRSRSGNRKAKPPKSPKKSAAKKPDAAANIKEEDRKLLKEVGKKGSGEPIEIRQLIEEGANPKCVNKDGIPVLHVAVQNSHHDAIPVLIQEGADVNVKGPGGNTALHEAVMLGPSASKVIDALLKCNADVNMKNNRGDSAYDMAVKDGQEGIVRKFASFLGQSTLDKMTKPRPALSASNF